MSLKERYILMITMMTENRQVTTMIIQKLIVPKENMLKCVVQTRKIQRFIEDKYSASNCSFRIYKS